MIKWKLSCLILLLKHPILIPVSIESTITSGVFSHTSDRADNQCNREDCGLMAAPGGGLVVCRRLPTVQVGGF